MVKRKAVSKKESVIEPKPPSKILGGSKRAVLLSDEKVYTSDIKELVSTGVLSIDIACGGGFPFGRVVEVYGDFSTGKTLLGIHAIREVQRMGGYGMYLDIEGSHPAHFIGVLGIDKERFVYVAPGILIEECWEEIEIFLAARKKDKKPGVIVWDSVAGSVAKLEVDKKGNVKFGAEMAARARAMGHIRKVTGALSKSRVCLVLVNQTRDNVGVMYGDDIVTVGGRAIKFHSTLRLWLRMGKRVRKKEGAPVIGLEGAMTTTKNKFSPPYVKANFITLFDRGIMRYKCGLPVMVQQGLLEQNGSWYSIPGEEDKFQSTNLKTVLADNADKLLPDSWKYYLKEIK